LRRASRACFDAKVTYLVFSQAPEGSAVPDLVARASARFDVTVTAVAGESEPTAAKHSLRASGHGIEGRFSLAVRTTNEADIARARVAEAAGRAAGMATLATRCNTVWVVSPDDDSPEWLALEVSAVLAFAALGPILPADDSTLLGVRSAQARAEALRRSA
jgi:hypothetical protein